MIERKSFRVDVPDGSSADNYIPDAISNVMFDEGIKEDNVITINESYYDGIYTIKIYYKKG